MLSKLQRLYRGLCWLMDTDCGMPWDMASLGELREQVTALEEKADRNAGSVKWISLLWERLTALENQTPYACNIEPNAEDEAQHVYATVTDTDTKEVYEGRLPLTNAGQPDPKPAPVICSPLTKMGLTAVTDAQFRKMAEYVVAALVNPSCDCRSEDAMVAATTDALQAYAKGDR
jgi:hypothetical protein